MNLDKELIQKMHDAYMIEYQNNLKHDQDYKQMAKDQNTWQLNLNANKQSELRSIDRKFNEEYLKHTNQVELKIKTAMLKEILKDVSSQYSEGN